MRDEAKKLEEFREKQKEARKKVISIATVVHGSDRGILTNNYMTLHFQIEQQMDALHKQKSSQFKKTMDVSINYIV